MKNLFIYHFITIVPIFGFVYAYNYDYISVGWLVIISFIYAFIYRPMIDFLRLKELEIMTKDDF